MVKWSWKKSKVILDMWVYAEGMHGYVFEKKAVPFGTLSLSTVFQQGHLCFSGSCLATWAEGQLDDLAISQDPPKPIKNTQFGGLVMDLETTPPPEKPNPDIFGVWVGWYSKTSIWVIHESLVRNIEKRGFKG